MAEQAQAAAPQAAPRAPGPTDQRGVPDAVQRVQAILNAENAPPEQPAAPQAQQEQAPQEASPEQPQEQEAPAVPNKQQEGDEQLAQRETAELPVEQVEAIELEVTTKGDDGRDVTEKLPVKALREGYMRQADYQRKTAALARQREEVATNTRQAIEESRTQMQQQLQQLQALVMETVAPELQGTDLNKLATDDPFEYVKRRNRLDQLQQVVTRIQTAQQELTAKQKAEMETKRNESLTKARETLQAEIPGWNDTLYQQVMKSAENYGYTLQEVAQWSDPRAIKLLYAAEKGKTAQPKAPSADKKVVSVPKVVRPGASPDQTQSAQRQQSALKRLGETGKLDDAAAVIAARFR